MKKLNLTLAILTALSTTQIAYAETTVTTTEYTQKTNESIVSQATIKKSDKEIIKSLDNRINNYPDLKNSVSFIVQDGIVILKGSVDMRSQKDYTAMMASATPGVVRVDNLISIK